MKPVAGSENSGRAQENSSREATPPVAFLPGVRTVAAYASIQAWAIANGLCRRCQPVNLYAVNDLRQARGLPPFALKEAGGKA